MEYHRRGPHQGFWRLKPNWVVPSKAEMLKMVGPEQIVLSESMQVGQRHLQDAGYSGTQDTGGGDDDSHLSIEQQLAPWITTKNFIFATQAKAMLRLHGDGDPTGRGEAFSFIRVSMKDIFVKAGEDYEQKLGLSFLRSRLGLLADILFRFVAEAENRPKSAHRYNVAEQQLIYKSEIERIWKAQFASLSRKDEPQLTDDEDDLKSLAVSARGAEREPRALASGRLDRRACRSPVARVQSRLVDRPRARCQRRTGRAASVAYQALRRRQVEHGNRARRSGHSCVRAQAADHRG
jgi:hypothetical protein